MSEGRYGTPITTRWVRNAKGTVLHHADCPRARPVCGWEWPENHGYDTDERLLLGIESAGAHWIKPCRICFDRATPTASKGGR